MTSFPPWLENAVPALRQMDIAHVTDTFQFIASTGADPAAPILTLEGWTEFGRRLGISITGRVETAQRPLRELARLDGISGAWDPILSGLIERAIDSSVDVSRSELGSYAPAELLDILGASGVEELFARLIGDLAASAQPVTDLLTYPNPVSTAASTVLSSYAGRHLDVWWSRNMYLGRGPTLAVLGSQHGITPARVQQIEATAERRVGRLLVLLGYGPVGVAAHQVRKALGLAYPVDQLRWSPVGLDHNLDKTLEDLSGGVGPAQLGLLLLRLAGPYRLAQGWLYRDLFNLFTKVRSVILPRDNYPELAEAELTLNGLGVIPEVQRRLIQETEGLKVLGGRVWPWSGVVRERVEVVLRARGEPMSKSDIAKAVERNLGTVANVLSTSDRFERMNVDYYGLTEWPGPRYDGIVQAMAEAIRLRGGSASMRQISEDVLERFAVSPNSIKTYLASNQFVRMGTGLYRIRGTRELSSAPPRVSLEESGSCFFLHRGWALRFKVNEERASGSGVGIPLAFAWHVGLRPNKALLIPVTAPDGVTPLGRVRFTWPAQMPTIGSVAQVVTELQLNLGDFLFLKWDAEGSVISALGTRAVQDRGLSERHVQSRIAAFIGRADVIGSPSAVVLSNLSEALGLSPEAGRSAVISRLLRRRDEDLTQLSRVLYDLEALRTEAQHVL